MCCGVSRNTVAKWLKTEFLKSQSVAALEENPG